MEWQPTTVHDVKQIADQDLAACDAEHVAAFERYRVQPCPAPIVRYDTLESVVVVARRGGEVVYWEDVDDGFNLSPLADDGTILEHWCNQDNLGLALNCWIEGRRRPPNIGPAVRVG